MRKWRSSSTWSRPEITEAPRHSLRWHGAIRTAWVWKKCEENAVVWYKKAAEQCDAEAQCALGECYYQARGVEKDDKEARRWYEAAATQGNVTAQYMTGRLYAALSYNVAAVKWYTKAAEQECPEAQYELGVCYEAGDGVGKDEAKAAELYRKAAVQGYAEAQKKTG